MHTRTHTNTWGCVTGHSLNGHDDHIAEVLAAGPKSIRANLRTASGAVSPSRAEALRRWPISSWCGFVLFLLPAGEVRSAVRPSGWALPAEAASLDFNGNRGSHKSLSFKSRPTHTYTTPHRSHPARTGGPVRSACILLLCVQGSGGDRGARPERPHRLGQSHTQVRWHRVLVCVLIWCHLRPVARAACPREQTACAHMAGRQAARGAHAAGAVA